MQGDLKTRYPYNFILIVLIVILNVTFFGTRLPLVITVWNA